MITLEKIAQMKEGSTQTLQGRCCTKHLAPRWPYSHSLFITPLAMFLASLAVSRQPQ